MLCSALPRYTLGRLTFMVGFAILILGRIGVRNTDYARCHFWPRLTKPPVGIDAWGMFFAPQNYPQPARWSSVLIWRGVTWAWKFAQDSAIVNSLRGHVGGRTTLSRLRHWGTSPVNCRVRFEPYDARHESRSWPPNAQGDLCLSPDNALNIRQLTQIARGWGLPTQPPGEFFLQKTLFYSRLHLWFRRLNWKFTRNSLGNT